MFCIFSKNQDDSNNDLEEKIKKQADDIERLNKRINSLVMRMDYSCLHHKEYTYYSERKYTKGYIWSSEVIGDTTFYWDGHERIVENLYLSPETEINNTNEEGIIRVIDKNPASPYGFYSESEDKKEYLINLISGDFWIV